MAHSAHTPLPRRPATTGAVAAGLLLLVLARPATAELRKVTETFDDGSPREVYGVDASDRRQGTAMAYHRDGRIRVRSTYLDGQLHGNLIRWDADGRKLEVALYRRDQLSGPRQIFAEGVRVREELWLAGIRIADRSRTQITRAIARIEKTPIPGAAPTEAAALRRLMVYRYLCRVPHEAMTLDARL
ncbi:MAG: hypothetical protein OER86_14565, partial [Phycisphaerae bacterium]|nr:hypothetical protein [Phycisphaerae bacterium]